MGESGLSFEFGAFGKLVGQDPESKTNLDLIKGALARQTGSRHMVEKFEAALRAEGHSPADVYTALITAIIIKE